MSERAEIELLAMKVAGIISQFKTPSHERGVLNGAVEELRRLASEVETLRAALAQAQSLPDGWKPRRWAHCATHGIETQTAWGCPDCLAELRRENNALRAASPAQPVQPSDPWLPIETAPRNGTHVLLWEQWSEDPFVGWWDSGEWRASHEHVDAAGGWDGAIVIDCIECPVMHWMPLPPAPQPKD